MAAVNVAAATTAAIVVAAVAAVAAVASLLVAIERGSHLTGTFLIAIEEILMRPAPIYHQ